MSEVVRASVLDVGQCTPDHNGIRAMLTRHFDVEVDRVMHVDEALDRMRRRRYTLVLVNRRIFDNDADGTELIRLTRADERLRDVPIMLVSNYPDAQASAVADGAVPGFGKAALHDPATTDRLAGFLSRRT